MREAVRRILIDHIEAVRVMTDPEDPAEPEPDYDLSNVYELHAVTKDTPRPWIVLQVAAPDPAEPFSDMAQTLNVWPNVSQESYQDLDALIAEIETVLAGRRFAVTQGEETRQFYVEQRPGGEDAIQDEWGGITKLLRFVVYELGWLSFETFDPDPIKALRAWAESVWPVLEVEDEDPIVQIQTDPSSWDPTDASPGIYFRLAGIPRRLTEWATHVTVEARIMVHVLAPSSAKRLEWTRRVVEELYRTRRIMLTEPNPYDPEDTIESPMHLNAVGADSTASPFTTGQITILGEYGILIPSASVPAIEQMFVSGDVEIEEGV